MKDSRARMLLCTRYLAARTTSGAKARGQKPSGVGTGEMGSLAVLIPPSCFVTILCASPSRFQDLGDFWNVHRRELWISSIQVRLWFTHGVIKKKFWLYHISTAPGTELFSKEWLLIDPLGSGFTNNL